jgi:hypothetical protein
MSGHCKVCGSLTKSVLGVSAARTRAANIAAESGTAYRIGYAIERVTDGRDRKNLKTAESLICAECLTDSLRAQAVLP